MSFNIKTCWPNDEADSGKVSLDEEKKPSEENIYRRKTLIKETNKFVSSLISNFDVLLLLIYVSSLINASVYNFLFIFQTRLFLFLYRGFF